MEQEEKQPIVEEEMVEFPIPRLEDMMEKPKLTYRQRRILSKMRMAEKRRMRQVYGGRTKLEEKIRQEERMERMSKPQYVDLSESMFPKTEKKSDSKTDKKLEKSTDKNKEMIPVKEENTAMPLSSSFLENDNDNGDAREEVDNQMIFNILQGKKANQQNQKIKSNTTKQDKGIAKGQIRSDGKFSNLVKEESGQLPLFSTLEDEESIKMNERDEAAKMINKTMENIESPNSNVEKNSSYMSNSQLDQSFLRLEKRMEEKFYDLRILVNSSIPSYISDLEECLREDIIMIKEVIKMEQPKDIKPNVYEDDFFENPYVSNPVKTEDITPDKNNSLGNLENQGINNLYQNVAADFKKKERQDNRIELKHVENDDIENYQEETNLSNDEKLIPEVSMNTNFDDQYDQLPPLEQVPDFEDAMVQDFDQLPLPLPTFDQDPSIESAIVQQLDQLPPLETDAGMKARFEVANQLDQLLPLDKPPENEKVSQNVDITDPSLYQSQILYYCKNCPLTTETKADLKAHMMGTHTNSLTYQRYQTCPKIAKADFYRSFKCSKCPRSLRKKKDLIEHIQGKHQHIRNIKCKFCEYTSAYRRHIKYHENTVHCQQPRARFQCAQCTSSFLGQKSLESHINVHHNEFYDPKGFKCDYCDHAYGTIVSLRSHARKVHINVKSYVCDQCGVTLKSKETYVSHRKVKHDDDKKHRCEECGYRAAMAYNLKIHIRSVHTKIKDLVCQEPLCGFATTYQGSLNSHVRTVHQKIKEKICEECGYATVTNSDLTKHVNAVHLGLKRFKCDECEYETTQSSIIKLHVKAIHRKIQDQICPSCDFVSAYQGKLKRHMMRAHGLEFNKDTVVLPQLGENFLPKVEKSEDTNTSETTSLDQN